MIPQAAFGLIGFFLFFSFVPSRASSEAVVGGLRHWSSPNCTRIVLDLSKEVSFKEFSSGDGSVVEIEFDGLIRKSTPGSLKIEDGTVKEVRIKENQKGKVRLWVKKASSLLKHTVFVLPKVNGKPVRLMVDVENPFGSQKEKLAESTKSKPQMESSKKRRAENVNPTSSKGMKIVVIDPGHGGEDPGAIGSRGVREKDLVLEISKRLKRELELTGKFRAFLTRSSDYFIPLRERVRIARELGADLFISIHADSSSRRDTRGASVYCLSLSGATDEAARILAEKENASDLIGGVRLTDDNDLNTILVDLLQTQTINDSLRFGSMLLESIGRVHEVKFSAPKQAGFRVLKAPDIPSVLVEVGFLSNPREESFLLTSAFQSRLAQALARGVERFLGMDSQESLFLTNSFSQGISSPKDKGPSSHLKADGRPKEHVVQPGQTLSEIATIYGKRVKELQVVNNVMDPSRLRPGQKILIP